MLDVLKTELSYLKITTPTMMKAAELWAESRRSGLANGDPLKLDIAVILAAQALTSGLPNDAIIVATSNPAHLSRFVLADFWTNIKP